MFIDMAGFRSLGRELRVPVENDISVKSGISLYTACGPSGSQSSLTGALRSDDDNVSTQLPLYRDWNTG